MESVKNWEQKIIEITTQINQEYPELTKYITEMPVKNSGEDSEGINSKNLEEYYNSLVAIVDKYGKTHETEDSTNLELPGYPSYPASEDIYNKEKEEQEINPENLSKNKAPNEDENQLNEKDFNDDMIGDDLDIPGSELDDQQENIGSEDEENNYYSLGGDEHNDLEEDKG